MANLGLKESLIVIASARGVGKTTAALTHLPPSRVGEVFVHDSEGSSNNIVEKMQRSGLEFGYRNNLDDMWKAEDLPGEADLLERIRLGTLPWANTKERDSMIAYWKYVIKDIDENLKQDKFSVYVFDPVERLESAMQAYVSENRRETGWQRMAYGEMWTKGFYPLYRALFSAIRQRGVDVIILTAHLGNPWTDEGPIPGKVRPRAKPELFKLAQFYVWLTNEPNNSDGAPAGIVLKERLGTVDVSNNDTWVLERRLPRRIPHFTWDDVEAYLTGERPCDLANPQPGEVLTPEEQEMIDDALSDRQMQLMLYRAKTTLAEAISTVPTELGTDGNGELVVPGEDPEQLAIRLFNSGDGISLEQISKKLNKPIPLVKRWVDA
jgi:hypothetical protein